MKITITETQNTHEGIYNRLVDTEEWMRELEDTVV